jgi:hypothetical protein
VEFYLEVRLGGRPAIGDGVTEPEPAEICDLTLRRGRRLNLPLLRRRAWYTAWVRQPGGGSPELLGRTHDHWVVVWLPLSFNKELKGELNHLLDYLEQTGWSLDPGGRRGRRQFRRPLRRVGPEDDQSHTAPE